MVLNRFGGRGPILPPFGGAKGGAGRVGGRSIVDNVIHHGTKWAGLVGKAAGYANKVFPHPGLAFAESAGGFLHKQGQKYEAAKAKPPSQDLMNAAQGAAKHQPQTQGAVAVPGGSSNKKQKKAPYEKQ